MIRRWTPRAERPAIPVQPTAPTFTLARELGAGTSGRVWLGTLTEPFADLGVGASVAVKVLHGDTGPPTWRSHEEEVAQAAQHPSLVRVLFSGPHDGRDVVVMEFVPGESMREALDRAGWLPEPRVRAFGAQVARGLAALHAAGWTHADVKPANVRVDDDGRAVLIDLGFARRLDSIGEGRPGSLAYLSPHRVRGAAPVAADDVFALGVTLYELATGVHPFLGEGARGTAAAEDAERLVQAVVDGEAVAPSSLVPGISALLDELLREMLSPDPADRGHDLRTDQHAAEGHLVGDAQGAVEVHRPQDDVVVHLRHRHLDRGDVLPNLAVVVEFVDLPRGPEHQELELLDLDPAVGDLLLHHALRRQRPVPGLAGEGSLAHHVERLLELRDGAHGVVDPTAAEAHLGDGEGRTRGAQ